MSGMRSSLLQKANGGEVRISDEARRKSSHLVAQWNETGTNASSSSSSSSSNFVSGNTAIPTNNSNVRVSSLLQTAGGNKVVISEAARQKAQQFVTRVEKENNNPQPKSISTPSEGSKRVSSLLQKASGGQVVISDDARQRSNQLMDKWGRDDAPNHGQTKAVSSLMRSPTSANRPPKVVVSSLLQKANGGNVVISDEARRKAEHMLQQTPAVSSNHMSSSSKQGEGRVSSLLQKASGGKVIISEQSSKKAMQILKGSKDEVSTDKFQRPASTSAVLRPQTQLIAADKTSITSVQTHMSNLDHSPTEFVYHLSSQKIPDIVKHQETACTHVEMTGTHSFITAPLTRPMLFAEPIYFKDILPARKASLAVDPRLSVVRRLNSTNLLHLTFQQNGTLQPTLPWNAQTMISTLARNESFTNQLIQFLSNTLQIPLASWPEQRWLLMQFNWILWTLVSWERRRPDLYLGQLANLPNIVEALRERLSIYYCPNPIVKKVQQSSASKKRKNGSTVTESLAVRKGPHKTAREHFSYKGAMSPLQRCADIACLVWPLCLVVSIPPQTSSTIKMQVTDGWWWLPANIDPYIQNLIDKNLLQDGFKITIFHATFRMDGNEDQTSINLSYNAVRKARIDAPLGFIAPHFLTRGISLTSVHESKLSTFM